MASAYEIAKQVERDSLRLTEIEAQREAIPPLTEPDPAAKAAYLTPSSWGRLLAVLLELVPSFFPALLMWTYRLSQDAEAKPAAPHQLSVHKTSKAKALWWTANTSKVDAPDNIYPAVHSGESGVHLSKREARRLWEREYKRRKRAETKAANGLNGKAL